VASARHGQDAAAAALLAIVAFGLYSYRAGQPSQAANEKPLTAAVDLLTTRGGHDDAGRFLPAFVRVSSDLWLPPVPPYTTLAIATVRRAQPPGRQSAAVFGALGVVLTYAFACDLFRQRAFGWIAASHQLGAASAAFFAGYVRSVQGSYFDAFIFAGFTAILAALLSLMVRGKGGAARPALAA